MNILAPLAFSLVLAAPSTAIAPIDPLLGGALCATPVSQQGPALVSADPKPGVDTWIYDNQISMTFKQKIEDHSVVVTDSEGCTVSQSEEVSGDSNRLVVHMRACKKMGYPGGHMTVRYTINGTSGEYHLHVRHHH
jgi:hypothetical protein